MKLLISILLLSSSFAFSQTHTQAEVDELKTQVKELTETINENSEIIKLQLKDQYLDQNSRGYLELKFGRAKISPDDIEDENNDTFNDLDDARWGSFDYANILEVEFGKTFHIEEIKHEFGIGYQHLKSKTLQASFTPGGGGSQIKVLETITFQTIYARYSPLYKISENNRIFFGPGITLGYSPSSDILIQIEQNDEGVQVKGEGTSYLLEVFGKLKYELTRYFFLVSAAGYKMQKARNIRLNAAELVNIKTTSDLDMSGAFATVGIAVSF